jgi:hypothetical protein
MLYDDLTYFDIRCLVPENPLTVGDYTYTFCARSTISTKSSSSAQPYAYLKREEVGVSSVFGAGSSLYALTDSNRPSKVLALDNTDDNTLPRNLYFEYKNGDTCI